MSTRRIRNICGRPSVCMGDMALIGRLHPVLAEVELAPHHGTLLRVSKDGTKTDILATGFRAPNGVCVNPKTDASNCGSCGTTLEGEFSVGRFARLILARETLLARPRFQQGAIDGEVLGRQQAARPPGGSWRDRCRPSPRRGPRSWRNRECH